MSAAEGGTGRTYPPLEPWRVGVRGACPRCGRGHLFKGFLSLRERCEVCGLDYSFADPADGPAFFVLCFTCIPAMILAVWLEVAFEPPLWVHLVVSLPVLLASCILPLRPLKGWLVASQFYHKAAEGRLVRPGEDAEPASAAKGADRAVRGDGNDPPSGPASEP